MEDTDSVKSEERNLTSTPLPSVAVPHLQDPGEHLQEVPKSQDIPEFIVRLGTSLTRSETESQYKLLQKEFKDNPAQITLEVEPKWKQKTLSSGTGSIRSSGKVSPVRRRSSVTSLSQYETQFCLLSRGVGKFYRRRRRTSRAVIQLPTPPSPMEENVFKEPPLDRFRRAGRVVKIVSGIWLWMKRYVLKPDTSQWSFVEMYIHLRDDLNQILTFNVNSYGKCEPIMALMRDNASFQDYPVHTQIQMARCMEYQHYEARRVILKQGHPPSMFYIMLTGTAIVNILDTNPTTGVKFVRTVHTLNAGDTFGEIALLEGCVRTASIICKTTCEFLVVHKEDFDVIIREPLRIQRLQHVEFCKSLPIFKDFPCDVFVHNPTQFFYQYFREGDVIVKDSLASKYIIVVKAGICKVVSTFKEKATRTHLDVLRMFEPEFEHAFPEYTTIKKIHASSSRPKTDSKSCVADTLHIGVNGTIDRRKLTELLTKNGERSKGLESLLSKPSTQLSLISEGAECILISKALFLNEANVKVLRIVSDFIQGFPSHDYIKEQAQSYRTWVNYKKDLEREARINIYRKHKAWVGGIPTLKCIDCLLKD
ncbi:hypothetical protein FSP39_018822 [Pinctada imbricata]|uniref:Cyclic nucleotide-binding domain-containing protein n=1 Tax=Pinctada imbricata TaxID=66713 RepID=A0AA88YEW6_PINIB|nr:hypothetical protein FSP39_018822 [Pinctada imbricata]